MRNLLLSLAVAALLWLPAFSQGVHHNTDTSAKAHKAATADDFNQHTEAATVAIVGALAFLGVCGISYWWGFVSGEDRR